MALALQAQETFKAAYDRGEVAREGQKWSVAIVAFRQAAALAANETQNARACYRIGEMYGRQGEMQVAMEWMKKSLALHYYEKVEQDLKALQRAEWARLRSAENLRDAILAAQGGRGPQLEEGVSGATDVEVLFDFDEATLKAEAVGQLRELGRMLGMEGVRERRFRVVGHTDRTGGAVHNQGLSERRAEAVCRYLVGQMGVAAGRLEARGMGARMLRYQGEGEEDHRLNRRVEVQMLEGRGGGVVGGGPRWIWDGRG